MTEDRGVIKASSETKHDGFLAEIGPMSSRLIWTDERSESCMHSSTISMCFYSSTCMIHIHIHYYCANPLYYNV